jgi:hypothetical protein
MIKQYKSKSQVNLAGNLLLLQVCCHNIYKQLYKKYCILLTILFQVWYWEKLSKSYASWDALDRI